MRTLRLVMASAIYPPDAGGPATFVPGLARRLHAAGHEVCVVAVAPDERPAAEPFPVLKVSRSLPRGRRLLEVARRLWSRGVAADAFFVNTLELPAVPVARLLGRPVVVKVVGDPVWERAVRNGWTDKDILAFQEAPADARVRLLRALYSCLYRSAHRVIVPSRFLGGLARGWGVREDRIRVVPNAVEDVFFGRNGHRGPGGPRLAAVARLVPWKGLDGVIRAMKGLPRTATLRIVGDGPLRAELEKQVSSLGLSERVRFEGQRSQEELAAILKETDIFVLNSTYEGCPHAVLEAMASGCTVAATTAGGTPELLKDGENALLVRPGDSKALEAALSSLAADASLRSRLAEGGRRLAAQRRWDATVDGVLSVIRETLA